MENTNILYQTINTQKEALKNFNPEIFEIPQYISENIKHNFFDWQKEAFENFLFYENPKSKLQKKPTHLMFNMATGTGKTLLMAACLLYYYKQGYRHFLFFVNQNNIVDKTENNFIDNFHTKYLFKEKIVIDNKTVEIKKVENFSSYPQSIEIKFTTIQKLYNDIHLERENQTSLDDLIQNDIIMLADEAHHLNTDTKSNGQDELFSGYEQLSSKSTKEIEKKGWEHTVINLILNKNGTKQPNRNVLLEFTATIPTEQNVFKKYKDKIIYKFGLKEFLQAGYTKEINLISSTFNKKERILQALVFNWYRHKIALESNIPNFKPVMLFRSKTIEESKSDFDFFLSIINSLTTEDFDFLKSFEKKVFQSDRLVPYEMGKSRTEQVLRYINQNKILYSEIVDFLKYNFSEKNCIITNSKTNKTKTEQTDAEIDKLLNSLEDKDNYIRAIFTVERLTEGWDVLNLYDIVRLYEGQNAGGSSKTTPEATIKEKQLIGRGVRYFPFIYKDKEKNKRKFDDDMDNKMRILEELFYYTFDEKSRYISHLKEELKKDGYISDDKITHKFKLKDEFKNTMFYKQVRIWYNKPADNPERKKKTLVDIKKNFTYTYNLPDLEYQETKFGKKDFEQNKQSDSKANLKIDEKPRQTIIKTLKDFDLHIIKKAINIKAKSDNSILRFENIKLDLDINSIDEIIKTNFLGDFEIQIIAPSHITFDDILNKDKLEALLEFFEKFETEFYSILNPKKGTEFNNSGSFEQIFGEPKTKRINQDSLNADIPKNDWYVLDSFAGTDQEESLIRFIEENIGNLKKNYEKVYLLRNEEVYKIYDFEKGRGFNPDFLLFLEGNELLYYQIFIEPKSTEYIGSDNTFKSGKEGWKESFLKQITNKYGSSNLLKAENKEYSLIGLPFYNTNEDVLFHFESDFKTIIG